MPTIYGYIDGVKEKLEYIESLPNVILIHKEKDFYGDDVLYFITY